MGRAEDRRRLQRTLSAGRQLRPGETAQDQIREFSQGWYDMMTRIWRDRLMLLQTRGTGNLLRSVTGENLQFYGLNITAAFRFVEYGMYVDRGTGRGYRMGNGGELKFLDRTERYKRKLGRPRRKTKWFSKSWYISQKVFNEEISRILGAQFIGSFDVFHTRR